MSMPIKPAFNFYNLDTIMAAIRAAEEETAPFIAQIYFSHYEHYNGGDCLGAAALELIRASSVPIALHLDHSNSYYSVLNAIRAGFNSVMIDGSRLPYEENITLTCKVVEAAHLLDVYTEAELGKIFRIGKDANVTSDYTSVEDAFDFCTTTGIDSFAPAVGTAHGMYTEPPKIRFDLIKEIHQAVRLPLVLHGGSGIPDADIERAILCGIKKVNVGSQLKYTWGKSVAEAVGAGEREIHILSAIAIDAVTEVVREKIRLFGANGKAENILSEKGTL